MVHLAECAGAHSLEGEEGIVGARVCRWEVFRVEDRLKLRAAAEVRPDEPHELVHGSLVWDETPALYVRDLKARLGTAHFLGAL